MTEAKTMPPGRALVLNTVLSVFISCVVFAVIARVILVPQMAREEVQIRELQAQVVAMQGQLDAAAVKPEVAPSPAPTAAPGTPAAQAAPLAPAPVPAAQAQGK